MLFLECADISLEKWQTAFQQNYPFLQMPLGMSILQVDDPC